VAQAFDVAGITNMVGAPSFAQFAKGGNHERLGSGAYLAMTKTLWGIAAHPFDKLTAGSCKERKDGHPQHGCTRQKSKPKAGPPPSTGLT